MDDVSGLETPDGGVMLWVLVKLPLGENMNKRGVGIVRQYFKEAMDLDQAPTLGTTHQTSLVSVTELCLLQEALQLVKLSPVDSLGD